MRVSQIVVSLSFMCKSMHSRRFSKYGLARIHKFRKVSQIMFCKSLHIFAKQIQYRKVWKFKFRKDLLVQSLGLSQGFTIGTLLMRTRKTIYLIWINNEQHCTVTQQRRYKHIAQKKKLCEHFGALPAQLWGDICHAFCSCTKLYITPG